MRSSGGFVNTDPDFVAPGTAASGASDMIVEGMGMSGRHGRTTIDVAPLPPGACIEVEDLRVRIGERHDDR